MGAWGGPDHYQTPGQYNFYDKCIRGEKQFALEAQCMSRLRRMADSLEEGCESQRNYIHADAQFSGPGYNQRWALKQSTMYVQASAEGRLS